MTMDPRLLFFIFLFVTLVVLFVLRLRLFVKYSRMRREAQKEIELFVKNFDPSRFADFAAFNFRVWSFSHVSPFPTKTEDEWRYTVYLAKPETEDIQTIVHEITECTIGRIIEKLLQLKKPLYLQRKQEEKFWVNGRQSKYLLEHILTTLGELDNIPKEKLEERIAPQDLATWQLNSANTETTGATRKTKP